MKVLITGVTGFIGSALAHRLLVQGHEVSGIVRHVTGRDFRAIESIRGEMALHACDVTSTTSVRNALRQAKPEVVIHLAALSPVRLSFEHPLDYQLQNYLATVNVAEAVRDLFGPHDVRVVIASTAEVYGVQGSQPFQEDLPLLPSSPYAVSKAAGDMYLRMLHTVYGFNGVIMRNANTFGRRHDASFFTEYLISAMIRGEDVYVGAPESIREYTYVTDHVQAYERAMISKDVAGEVFNFGAGVGYTNLEWATMVADVTGFDQSKIRFGEYPPGYPYRPLASDQPYLVLDSSKARRLLGWEARVPAEEGLKRTVEYWRHADSAPRQLS